MTEILEASIGPEHPSVLLVPSLHAGNELLRAAALGRVGWMNVRVATPTDHAQYVIERSGSAPDPLFSSHALVMWVQTFLSDAGLSADEPFTQSVANIATALTELRLAGISARNFRKICQSDIAFKLADVFDGYENYLSGSKVTDAAELLKWARRLLVDEGENPDVETVVLWNSMLLSAAEEHYVRSLGERALHLFRIGPCTNASARHRRAFELFSDWPSVSMDSDVCTGGTSNARVFRAVGAENEIRAVFRDMIAREVPFDSVTLAYSKIEPYERTISALANRYGIETSSAAGVALTSTRVGQAIVQFLQWVADGASSARLVQMLRGGLVQLETDRGENADLSYRAADLLATTRLSGSKKIFTRFFDRTTESLQKDAAQAIGTFMEGSREELLRSAVAIRDALEPLLAMAFLPAESRLSSIVDRIENFLITFVIPGDRVLGSAEDEQDYRVAEYVLQLCRQLDRELPEPMPTFGLLRHLEDLLNRRRINASGSKPGAIHVAPFSAAGFASRPYLYLVGLDELTMESPIPAGPFLTRDVKDRVERMFGAAVLSVDDRSENPSREFAALLDDYAGDTTIIYSCFDIREGRELYLSSIVRSLLHDQSVLRDTAPALSAPDPKDALHSFAPILGKNASGIPMDETDVMLSAAGAVANGSNWSLKYPWISRGSLALQKRADPSWSEYDGMVRIKNKSSDPFSGRSRWSASKLETLVECPFRHFLKDVLKAHKMEEAEVDEWITPLEMGRLVHEVLAEFMATRNGDVSNQDLPELERMFFNRLSMFGETKPSTNRALETRIRTDLEAIARSFLIDELERQEYLEPFAFEFGFGVWPHNKQTEADSTEKLLVNVDGLDVNLVGRIDRIDRTKNGGYVITDYKTGSSRGFDPNDLLRKGHSLQWALYAYVVEEMLKAPVQSSGYLFVGIRESSLRIEADPSVVRTDVGRALKTVGRFVQAGSFFQAADENGACQFCDYQRVCGDANGLKNTIRSKIAATQPETPNRELLESWRYADKYLPHTS